MSPVEMHHSKSEIPKDLHEKQKDRNYLRFSQKFLMFRQDVKGPVIVRNNDH